MNTHLEEKEYNAGDIVWATARQPMPEEMEKELFKPQRIKEAHHPLYVFDSGWSVNVDLGDKLFEHTRTTRKIGTFSGKDVYINTDDEQIASLVQNYFMKMKDVELEDEKKD